MSATISDNAFKTLANTRQAEEDNMTAIVAYILSLDSNITCDTTVSAEYSNPDTTHVPTFNFTIKPNFILRLTRLNPLSTNFEKKYYISAIINGIEQNKTNYPFNDNQYYARFVTAIDTDFFFFWFGWGGSQDAGLIWSMAYVCDENRAPHGGTRSSSAPVDITLAQFYDLTDNSTGQFVTLINFNAPAGYLAFSDMCPFIGSGNTYLFGVKDLASCSGVTSFSTIALNNGRVYWAVAPHTVVEISS